MSTIAHAGDYRKVKPTSTSRGNEKQAKPGAKASSTCRVTQRLRPSAEHAAEARSKMLARYGSEGPRKGNRRPEETGRKQSTTTTRAIDAQAAGSRSGGSHREAHRPVETGRKDIHEDDKRDVGR